MSSRLARFFDSFKGLNTVAFHAVVAGVAFLQWVTVNAACLLLTITIDNTANGLIIGAILAYAGKASYDYRTNRRTDHEYERIRNEGLGSRARRALQADQPPRPRPSAGDAGGGGVEPLPPGGA